MRYIKCEYLVPTRENVPKGTGVFFYQCVDTNGIVTDNKDENGNSITNTQYTESQVVAENVVPMFAVASLKS